MKHEKTIPTKMQELVKYEERLYLTFSDIFHITRWKLEEEWLIMLFVSWISFQLRNAEQTPLQK